MNCETIPNPRIEFFDSIAGKWDGWHDLRDLNAKLDLLLEEFGIQHNESILDVGCGTGNFTISLLRKLGPSGRIVSVDISPLMLERARQKADDTRVTWLLSSAEKLQVENDSMDRVVCFSVWPHFDNHDAVTKEMQRVLRPGGYLHIAHLISRSKINQIHSEAHPSVHHDYLAPAYVTVELLTKNRLKVTSMLDNEQRYVISARKQE